MSGGIPISWYPLLQESYTFVSVKIIAPLKKKKNNKKCLITFDSGEVPGDFDEQFQSGMGKGDLGWCGLKSVER